MIQEAIDCYHSLLEAQYAAETHEALCAGLEARHLFFGKTPLCRVLRPHFYDRASWEYLRAETALVLKAFARAHTVCQADADLRAQLDLEPYEETLFSVDDGSYVPWSSSRLDAFFRVDDHYLKFVEYNAETPAGIGYGDQLSEIFSGLEVMRRFTDYYHVTPLPAMHRLLEVIVRAYRGWGGKADQPQIAIVDWAEVPTRTEHEICREYFEAHGCRARLADPRQMEYRDGALWADDFRVDVIYKRVLVSELIRQLGLNCDLVRAVRDRTVFMTNSFSAKLMAKKASFAFISDERNAHLFTPEEQEALNAHIPWTRRVSDRQTTCCGKTVDLLPFIADNQANLVLKPNDEYGGKGVVLGWVATAEEWQAAIHTALTTPFVVQERVDMVQRDFPMMIDGRLDISPRFIDADPYVFYGEEVGGCLTRLSSAALLNVTAGSGSVVPAFVIDRRED